jgi:hypothetical protein
MNALPNQSNPPSTFVTVLAWIFIVFSAFGLVGLLMQGVMFFFMFQSDFFTSDFSNDAMDGLRWFGVFWGFLAIWITSQLVVSIGLLKRKNWARILFIIGMVLLIAYSVLCACILFAFPGFIGQEMWNDPEFQDATGQKIFSTFRIAMVVFSLAFTVLWSWILTRLMSAKIKQEFVPDRSLPSSDNHEQFRR